MKQEMVRPADAFLALYLATATTVQRSYSELAEGVGVVASAAHASVARLCRSGLLDAAGSAWTVRRGPLSDFIVHGARYCYPPLTLSSRRGVVTGLHALEDAGELLVDAQNMHVWPDPSGRRTGTGLVPLHPSVPAVAAREPLLRETLALFDLLRVGRARERNFAEQRLQALLGA